MRTEPSPAQTRASWPRWVLLELKCGPLASINPPRASRLLRTWRTREAQPAPANHWCLLLLTPSSPPKSQMALTRRYSTPVAPQAPATPDPSISRPNPSGYILSKLPANTPHSTTFHPQTTNPPETLTPSTSQSRVLSSLKALESCGPGSEISPPPISLSSCILPGS